MDDARVQATERRIDLLGVLRTDPSQANYDALQVEIMRQRLLGLIQQLWLDHYTTAAEHAWPPHKRNQHHDDT